MPFGASFVMYTEKELNYYTAANTPAAGTATNSASGFTIEAVPGQYIAQDLAQFPTLPSTNGDRLVGPVTISMGLSPTSTSTTSAIVSLTCQQVDETTGTFAGCAVPSANNTWVWGKNSWLAAPGAALVDPSTLATINGEGSASNYEKLYKNNEDLAVLRVAWTTDGVNFSSAGLANDGVISGQNTCGKSGPSPACASAARAGVTHPYDDISNPTTTANPTNSGGAVNLNEYADNDAGNGTGPATGGTDTGGVPDATEMRWVGSAGSIIDQGGTYQLFLSGAWAADGDSDAFNHVFYSTSTDGQHWSVPIPVISTDYSFAASATQDMQSAAGQNAPLGIGAYYSGRAYAPSLVPNFDGTLTMVFGADRIPKSLATAGTVLGTGTNPYTIGPTDPALYRNILVATLTPNEPPFDRHGDGPHFDVHHQSLASRPRPSLNRKGRRSWPIASSGVLLQQCGPDRQPVNQPIASIQDERSESPMSVRSTVIDRTRGSSRPAIPAKVSLIPADGMAPAIRCGRHVGPGNHPGTPGTTRRASFRPRTSSRRAGACSAPAVHDLRPARPLGTGQRLVLRRLQMVAGQARAGRTQLRSPAEGSLGGEQLLRPVR